jgi:hypothetical protein
VTITVAHDAQGTTNAAIVSGGRFVTTQTRGRAPVTTFALSAPLSCAAHGRAPRAVVARAARRKGRSIRVKEVSGNFTTKGKYVAASVQGTQWTTSDACASSTVTVTSGLVKVTDLVKHRTVTLGAREHYTARR